MGFLQSMLTGNGPKMLARLLGLVFLANVWRNMRTWWKVDAKRPNNAVDVVVVWDLSPAHSLPGSDLAPRQIRRELLDACRQRGLAASSVFSKVWQKEQAKARQKVKVQGRYSPHYAMDLFSVPFPVLFRAAERLRMRKPVKGSEDGERRPFVCDRALDYDGFRPDRTWFTSDERQRVCIDILLSVRTEAHRAVLPLCVEHGVVPRFFPLHDGEARQEMLARWVRDPSSEANLDELEAYLGSETGYYFAFCSMYTTWLWLPAIAGVIAYTTGDTTHSLIFSVLIQIWTSLFVQSWRRRESQLALRWNTLHLAEQELIDEPRPGFSGSLALNPVTGRQEPAFARWKRALIYSLTIPILVVLNAGLVAFVWACLYFGDRVAADATEDTPIYVTLAPSVVRGVAVPVLNLVYDAIAERFTAWENHRTESEHRNSLVLKLVPFYAINYFLGNFYIAFYIRDFDRMAVEMAAIMVTLQITGQIFEVLVPYVTEAMRMRSEAKENAAASAAVLASDRIAAKSDADDAKAKSNAKGKGKGKSESAAKADGTDTDAEADADAEAEAEMEQVPLHEHESLSQEFPGTFFEYIELVMQYGYVVMFGAFWPLAAVFALGNNMVEVRSDAFKILTSYRRPLPVEARGMGAWLPVMEIFSYIGVATHCAYAAMIFLGLDVSGSNSDGPEIANYILPGATQIGIIGAVVIGEHVVMLAKWLLGVAIPDVPEVVRVALARERFRALELRRAVDGEPGSDDLTSAAVHARSIRS